MLKFDREFFRSLWYLIVPYWTSEEKWSAYFFLTLNIICSVSGVWLSVQLNTFNRDFFNALQAFDQAAIKASLLHFVFIVMGLIIAFGYAFYFNSILSVRWRRWLTKNYLQRWLADRTYYRMQLFNNHLDNPDQRITEDLESFPEISLVIFFILLQSSLMLIAYGVILWKLSAHFSLQLTSFTLHLPGYLFYSAFFYGIFGLLVMGWLGKKLAGLDYQQQHVTADFRFSLIRFREASEQIALYRGEAAENNRFDHFFSHIFNNFMKIVAVRRRLTFFSTGYRTIAFVIGIIAAVPLYLQRAIQLGGIMQISGAFSSVVGAFSSIVDNFVVFAQWRAIVSRLAEFNKSIQITKAAVHDHIKIEEHDSPELHINKLKLNLPSGNNLLSDIEITLVPGESLLLTGASGCGKTTVLRALAGLWSHGEGQIYFPKGKKLFFLPQKLYLPLGSLKDVLLYPAGADTNDEEINRLLENCGLLKFYNCLNEIKNWSYELSLGEQQLIGFVRLFIHKPDIIFLDEASSALDEKSELQMYQFLRNYLPEAMIISIGHRPSLYQFHQYVLMLNKDQHHELNKLGCTTTSMIMPNKNNTGISLIMR